VKAPNRNRSKDEAKLAISRQDQAIILISQAATDRPDASTVRMICRVVA
jgi:hypothetical protein